MPSYVVILICICIVFFVLGICITYYLSTLVKNKAINNIEAQHKLEIEALTKAKEKAEYESDMKSEYYVNMVHDIRTPINTVVGMTELILRENDNSDINEYANSISRAGKILNDLVNDILDVSKIESGKMELIEDGYDLFELLNDIVSVIKDKCNNKSLKFDVRVDKDIPVGLYGDEHRLRQVLVNLLTNAVKYTNEGKVAFEVRLVKNQYSDKVQLFFMVEDTGRGIKEDDIHHIFSSFTRVDELKNNKIEGTGLGLSIVYHLLQLMNSEIKVESIYGKGSKFYFTLTQGVIEDRPMGNYIERYNEQLEKKSTYRVSFIAPDARILVVDDNEMNLVVTSKLLNDTQIIVDTVDSGAKCLEKINEKKYNLILMDIKMPEMDGVEVLQKIRNGNSINSETAIIALTADASDGVREKYMRLGFADYMSKPFNVKRLESKIKKFIPVRLLRTVKENKTIVSSNLQLLDVKEGLKYCSNDAEMYNEILHTFFSIGLENIKKILILYQNEDWVNYGIQVHSLKSTSLNIGAIRLYDMARKLEEAVKANEIKYIVYNNDEMIDTYKKVLVEIEQYFDIIKNKAEIV